MCAGSGGAPSAGEGGSGRGSGRAAVSGAALTFGLSAAAMACARVSVTHFIVVVCDLLMRVCAASLQGGTR